MSKYMIRVSGPSSRGGGVYDGGTTLAQARKEAIALVKYAPHADIAIVKSAPYHKTRNPHEERLVIVESIQSPPIGGYRDPSKIRRDPRSKYMIRISGPGGGVFEGGNTLAQARKKGLSDTLLFPFANIDIVISAYGGRFVVVQSLQSAPITGRDPDRLYSIASELAQDRWADVLRVEDLGTRIGQPGTMYEGVKLHQFKVQLHSSTGPVHFLAWDGRSWIYK